MKVLATINLKELLLEHIEETDSNELIEMYHLLDEACVEIEDELIRMGVWEEDE